MDRPEVISDFFRDANCIDQHNHVRQFELALEKKWITHDCYFRLTTTKIGIDVTDTWHLMHWHRLFPFAVMQRFNFAEDGNRNMPIRTFAGSLAAQLLKKAKVLEEEQSLLTKRKVECISSDGESYEEDEMEINTNESIEEANNNGLTYITNGGTELKGCKVVSTFKDGNGSIHTLCKFPVVQTGKKMKRRCRVQPCDVCCKETTYFCFECKKSFCYCEKDRGHGRKCFRHHVPTRTSSRIGV